MIGSILYNARKGKGLSLEEVARLCNPYLSAGHLSALENEKKSLMKDRVYGLSEVLGLDADLLVQAIKVDRMAKCPWCRDCENIIKDTR